MKEQYIRQVKRELQVPRKQKHEILRDLEEAFSSALEHGESEKQIIERLGTPREFAISTEEQLGINRFAVQKRKQILWLALSSAVALLAFVLFGILQAQKLPANVIGRADAMTSIVLVGGNTINLPALLLGIGIATVLVLLAQIVKLCKRKHV